MRSLVGTILASIFFLLLIPHGSSQATAQTITVSPTSLAFGNQILGTTSASKSVTLTNGASSAITIAKISVTISDYVETSTCPVAPATLAAGASCIFSVTFTPQAPGSRTGTLAIVETGKTGTQKVPLGGAGIAAVAVTPTSVSYGNETVGLKSAGSVVKVTNKQAAPLTISSISTNLPDYTTTSVCPLSPKTLGAGASCTISVFFTPQTSGARNATLTVADNASNSPTVALIGTGIAPTLTSMVLSPSAASIVAGTTQQFTATGTYSDGSHQNLTASASWTSSTATIASVNSSGLASGIVAGQTTIAAISGAITGSASLSVSPATLVSLAITPANVSFAIGATQQFQAVGTYTDGSTQNVTTTASWSSGNAAVSAVNSQGLASGVGAGNTSVSATLGQVTGGATVIVTAAGLTSIAVTPSTPSVPAGTSLQFTATGTYADGSTQNLTASATWSSGNTTVTTVAANGLGSALLAGTATVTAASGTVGGSTVMIVISAGVVATAVRADLNLNGTWSYVLNQTQAQIPTTGWAQARVPDAPLYDGTTSIWYKNTLNIPATWMQQGRRFFLELEKSGHYAAVYINGTFMGEHFGQFSPFEVELTSGILGGQENEIEIYVHKADTVYVGSGVNVDQSSCPSTTPDCLGNSYRPAGVDGIQRNWVGVVGDITFSWRPSEYISDVSVVTSVRNMTMGDTLQVIGSGSATTVQAAVLDGGNVVLSLPAQPVVAGVGTLVVPWTNPVLWGTPPYGQPKLYMLQTTLLENGVPVDTIYTRFGFREVWVSGKSVLLNGQPLWLSGNYMLRASPLRTSDDRLPEAMQLHIQQGSGLIGQHFHWDDPGRPWLELADEMGIPVLAGFYCNGGDFTQAQTDDATAWTSWMAASAQEWAHARKNHPSIVLWRPMDVLPRGGANKTAVYPELAAAVRGQDLSARPIADGSDVDTWGQSGISTTNSTQCDDGSAFEAQLASETKPLIFKELYGLNLPCSPTFLQMIYQMAYSGGTIGLITQQLNLEPDQDFAPVWFSQSGRGNRPTTSTALPDWMTQQWTPTTWSQELTTLYTTSSGQSLPDTSPTSGTYQATQIPATAPTAFLVPPGGTGNPTGVAVASDATAWIIVPVAGSYQLAYGDGTNEVLQNVTALAPPPFP